jgi:hypothetical protein
VFEPGGFGDAFQARVFHNQIRREIFVEGDVNVFVNCRGDEEAAEFFVIRRQIRSATAKGDAKR